MSQYTVYYPPPFIHFTHPSYPLHALVSRLLSSKALPQKKNIGHRSQINFLFRRKSCPNWDSAATACLCSVSFSFLGVGPFVDLDKCFNKIVTRDLRFLWVHAQIRMPVFLSSRPNLVPPPPHPQGRVAPPPLGPRGETHSLGEGGGGWGDPTPTNGQTFWYSMYTIILLRYDGYL